MPATVEELARLAVELPPEQRFILAERILATTEPAASATLESLWDAEIVRRIAEFRAGRMETLSAEQVFAEVDAAVEQ